jgi:two-component sensor histidine kinase
MLGSRIIRALAAQLAATIHVDSSAQTGTTVTIRLSYTPAASPELTSAS